MGYISTKRLCERYGEMGKIAEKVRQMRGCSLSQIVAAIEVMEDHIDFSYDDVQQAFSAWNFMAGECGLPRASILNAKRKAMLRHRLKECGGIEGWRDALRMIPQSPFLMGENNSGFTATLDFVLQASSFTKLREGNYTKRGNGPAPQLKGLALVKEQLRQEIEGAGRGGPEGADHQAIQQLAFDVGRG